MKVRARICDGRTPLSQQVGDAVRDDARLAAARPGQHQQRPVAVRHGLALRLGEGFEKWVHIALIIPRSAVDSYIPSLESDLRHHSASC